MARYLKDESPIELNLKDLPIERRESGIVTYDDLINAMKFLAKESAKTIDQVITKKVIASRNIKFMDLVKSGKFSAKELLKILENHGVDVNAQMKSFNSIKKIARHGSVSEADFEYGFQKCFGKTVLEQMIKFVELFEISPVKMKVFPFPAEFIRAEFIAFLKTHPDFDFSNELEAFDRLEQKVLKDHPNLSKYFNYCFGARKVEQITNMAMVFDELPSKVLISKKLLAQEFHYISFSALNFLKNDAKRDLTDFMQEFFALNQMRGALRSDKTSFDHKTLFTKMIGGSSVAEQVFLVESSKTLAEKKPSECVNGEWQNFAKQISLPFLMALQNCIKEAEDKGVEFYFFKELNQLNELISLSVHKEENKACFLSKDPATNLSFFRTVFGAFPTQLDDETRSLVYRLPFEDHVIEAFHALCDEFKPADLIAQIEEIYMMFTHTMKCLKIDSIEQAKTYFVKLLGSSNSLHILGKIREIDKVDLIKKRESKTTKSPYLYFLNIDIQALALIGDKKIDFVKEIKAIKTMADRCVMKGAKISKEVGLMYFEAQYGKFWGDQFTNLVLDFNGMLPSEILAHEEIKIDFVDEVFIAAMATIKKGKNFITNKYLGFSRYSATKRLYRFPRVKTGEKSFYFYVISCQSVPYMYRGRQFEVCSDGEISTKFLHPEVAKGIVKGDY